MNEILKDLSLDDATLDDIKLASEDLVGGSFQFKCSRQVLEKALISLKKYRTKSGSFDIAASKILAYYLTGVIHHSKDLNEKCYAGRCYIQLCKSTGASAYGIMNVQALTTIISIIEKIVSIEIHSSTKKSTSSSTTQSKSTSSSSSSNLINTIQLDHLNEDDDNNDNNMVREEGNDMNEDILSAETPRESPRLVNQQQLQQQQQQYNISLSVSTVQLFLNDFKLLYPDIKSCSEEYIIESTIESLIGILYLTSLQPRYSDIDIIPLLYDFSSCSDQSLMMMYRSLMTGLTMTGRDTRIIDNSKARIQCHKAGIQVLLYFTERLPSLLTRWNQHTCTSLEENRDESDKWDNQSIRSTTTTTTDNNINKLNKRGRRHGSKVQSSKRKSTSSQYDNTLQSSKDQEDNNNDDDDVLSVNSSTYKLLKTPLSSVSTQRFSLLDKNFPIPNKYLVGALQRVVLLVPDRAPTRNLAADSILRVLTHIYNTIDQSALQHLSDNTTNSVIMTPLSTTSKSILNLQEQTMDTLLVLSHFMSFLIKLSKCNKAGHRAFSLDIITTILGTDWIWNSKIINLIPTDYSIHNTTTTTTTILTPSYTQNSIQYLNPKFLLTTLMERCIDIAPTVRIRALNTLCSLFETLNHQSPPSKCELLLHAAMGTLSTTNDTLKISDTNLNYSFQDMVNSLEDPSNINKNLPNTTTSSQSHPTTTTITTTTGSTNNTTTTTTPIGINIPSISTYHKSLIDIFRDSCEDERPLVRSKSVQALGSALTLEWPKYIHSNALLLYSATKLNSNHCYNLTITPARVTRKQAHSQYNDDDDDLNDNNKVNVDTSPTGSKDSAYTIENITMFVSADDLKMLASKCNDISLAVRKQAVIALTELTRTRPYDITIQDTWIHIVLPLIMDPESSVQMKVASSIQELLLNTIIEWSYEFSVILKKEKMKKIDLFHGNYDYSQLKDLIQSIYYPTTTTTTTTTANERTTSKNSRFETLPISRKKSSNNSSYQPSVSQQKVLSAWRLLVHIANSGQLKMVKTCIGLLFQYHILPSHKDTKTYLKEILDAAQLACCLHIISHTTSEMDMSSVSRVHDRESSMITTQRTQDSNMSTTTTTTTTSHRFINNSTTSSRSNMRESLVSKLSVDVDDIDEYMMTLSSGGWILLEVCVSQEAILTTATTNTTTTNNNTRPSQQSSDKKTSNNSIYNHMSADFIITCFIQKRQLHVHSSTLNHSPIHTTINSNTELLLDENDIRMLQVLEKLAMSLSLQDIDTMLSILFPMLLNMMLSTDAITVTLNTIHALIKAKWVIKSQQDDDIDDINDIDETQSPITKKKQSHKQSTKRDILESAEVQTHWVEDMTFMYGILLSSCNYIIDAFIQNKLPISSTLLYSTQSNTTTSTSSVHHPPLLRTHSIIQHLKDYISIPNTIKNMPPAYCSNVLADLLTAYTIKSDIIRMVVKNAIFTLGEISMLGFHMDEESYDIHAKYSHNKDILTNIHVHHKSSSSNTVNYSLPKYLLYKSNHVYQVLLPPSIVTYVQVLMGYYLPHNTTTDTTITSTNTTTTVNPSMSVNDQIRDTEIASDIRAFAFITMGKFCLRNKSLAQSLINVYLRELHHGVITSANNDYSIYSNDSLNMTTYSLMNNSTHYSTYMDAENDIVDSKDDDGGVIQPYWKTTFDTSSTLPASSSADNHVAVRSNALLVLGDLCVRYTNLVDKHVNILAKSLQDSHVIVRKHAIILLTQLLIQDYLKWRGMLLFRYLATATDKDKDTAEFSKSIFKKTILSKFPDFFCQHFTETIIIYNEWKEHPAYIATLASGSDGDTAAVTTTNSTTNSTTTNTSKVEGLNLSGPKNRKKRFALYSFMTEDFTEEQKIHVTAKLIDDILSEVIDNSTTTYRTITTTSSSTNTITSNSMMNDVTKSNMKSARKSTGSQHDSMTTNNRNLLPYEEALEDAFLLLRSPLLKIGKKVNDTSTSGDNDDDVLMQESNVDDVIKNGKAAVAKAKSIVLKKLSRQHLVSHVLPVIMSLKHVLETKKSSLQGSLMELLVSLVKSNKTEVDQVLSSDPCLKAELEYDLKLFEKSKEATATTTTTNRAVSEGTVRFRDSNGINSITNNLNNPPKSILKSSKEAPRPISSSSSSSSTASASATATGHSPYTMLLPDTTIPSRDNAAVVMMIPKTAEKTLQSIRKSMSTTKPVDRMEEMDENDAMVERLVSSATHTYDKDSTSNTKKVQTLSEVDELVHNENWDPVSPIQEMTTSANTLRRRSWGISVNDLQEDISLSKSSSTSSMTHPISSTKEKSKKRVRENDKDISTNSEHIDIISTISKKKQLKYPINKEVKDNDNTVIIPTTTTTSTMTTTVSTTREKRSRTALANNSLVNMKK